MIYFCLLTGQSGRSDRPSNFVNSNFVDLDGFNMLVNYDVHLNESI